MDITELSKELIEQIRNGASESDVIQLLADNYQALQLLQPDVSGQFNCLDENFAKGINACSEWCGEDMCKKESN